MKRQDGERGQDTVRESLCSTGVNVGVFKSYERNRLHGESTGFIKNEAGTFCCGPLWNLREAAVESRNERRQTTALFQHLVSCLPKQYFKAS